MLRRGRWRNKLLPSSSKRRRRLYRYTGHWGRRVRASLATPGSVGIVWSGYIRTQRAFIEIFRLMSRNTSDALAVFIIHQLKLQQRITLFALSLSLSLSLIAPFLHIYIYIYGRDIIAQHDRWIVSTFFHATTGIFNVFLFLVQILNIRINMFCLFWHRFWNVYNSHAEDLIF